MYNTTEELKYALHAHTILLYKERVIKESGRGNTEVRPRRCRGRAVRKKRKKGKEKVMKYRNVISSKF